MHLNFRAGRTCHRPKAQKFKGLTGQKKYSSMSRIPELTVLQHHFLSYNYLFELYKIKISIAVLIRMVNKPEF